jgi:hypothetical protein
MRLEVHLISGPPFELTGTTAVRAWHQLQVAFGGQRASTEDYRALVNKGDGAAVLRAVLDSWTEEVDPGRAVILQGLQGEDVLVPLTAIVRIIRREA